MDLQTGFHVTNGLVSEKTLLLFLLSPDDDKLQDKYVPMQCTPSWLGRHQLVDL